MVQVKRHNAGTNKIGFAARSIYEAGCSTIPLSCKCVVALAILLVIPIWTEDQDFFGSGIATWTTDPVELYLHET